MRTLLLLALLAASGPLPLGDRTLTLAEHDFGPGPLLVNLHADETTSVEAALAVARRRGGRVLNLLNDRERLVSFTLGGKRYVADPNRIFTGAGVPATLRKYGPDSKDAEAAVSGFARALLGALKPPPGAPLIALHNNTPDLSYSMKSYLPGGKDAGEVERTFEAPGQDPNDFFLVTEPSLFESLKARGFNVALQKRVPDTDDGSLSVWAAQHKLAYVNVEAQHGHLAQQEKMLEALLDVLAAK